MSNTRAEYLITITCAVYRNTHTVKCQKEETNKSTFSRWSTHAIKKKKVVNKAQREISGETFHQAVRGKHCTSPAGVHTYYTTYLCAGYTVTGPSLKGGRGGEIRDFSAGAARRNEEKTGNLRVFSGPHATRKTRK